MKFKQDKNVLWEFKSRDQLEKTLKRFFVTSIVLRVQTTRKNASKFSNDLYRWYFRLQFLD